MKESAYPPGVLGFVTKVLAYDEAEGDGSRVAKMAFALAENRRKNNLPGCPEDDWRQAEEIVKEEFAREIIKRLG